MSCRTSRYSDLYEIKVCLKRIVPSHNCHIRNVLYGDYFFYLGGEDYRPNIFFYVEFCQVCSKFVPLNKLYGTTALYILI